LVKQARESTYYDLTKSGGAIRVAPSAKSEAVQGRTPSQGRRQPSRLSIKSLCLSTFLIYLNTLYTSFLPVLAFSEYLRTHSIGRKLTVVAFHLLLCSVNYLWDPSFYSCKCYNEHTAVPTKQPFWQRVCVFRSVTMEGRCYTSFCTKVCVFRFWHLETCTLQLFF
jgi:hypothetical protein